MCDSLLTNQATRRPACTSNTFIVSCDLKSKIYWFWFGSVFRRMNVLANLFIRQLHAKWFLGFCTFIFCCLCKRIMRADDWTDWELVTHPINQLHFYSRHPHSTRRFFFLSLPLTMDHHTHYSQHCMGGTDRNVKRKTKRWRTMWKKNRNETHGAITSGNSSSMTTLLVILKSNGERRGFRLDFQFFK